MARAGDRGPWRAWSTALAVALLPIHLHALGGGTMKGGRANASKLALKDLRVTVVYDNTRHKPGLATAWGFACVVQGAEKTILFDTGGSGTTLLANMKKLGIAPKDIDLVVLSHIHGDHTGGLESFLRERPGVTVHVPASFPEQFKSGVERLGAKVVSVGQAAPVCAGVLSTGELGRGIREQALVLRTDKGLIVITGCAHPGIVEMVAKAKDQHQEDVLLAMGGFHLTGTSRRGVAGIVASLTKLGVRYAGPCHCTGDAAIAQFAEAFGSRFVKVGVGKVITAADFQ